MVVDAGSTDADACEEVMASIDGDTEPRLVIADVCAEDAWLSVPVAAASPLHDWR